MAQAPKRRRLGGDEAITAAEAFAVQRVVVTTDHGAEHAARAQRLATELAVHFDSAFFVAREGESVS